MKILRILALILATGATGVAASCQVERIEPAHDTAQTASVFTATFETPAEAQTPAVGGSQSPSAETRVCLGADSRTRWNAGDELCVFSSTANLKYIFDGKDGDRNGTFHLEGKEVLGDPVELPVGVYPYDEQASISGRGIITLFLPEIQQYKAGSFGRGANTMVAVTTGPRDNNLYFKNMCGYLVFRIYGQGTITSITLQGNNGEKLAGKASVTTKAENAGGSSATPPAIRMSSYATGTITLDCGDGVALGSTSSKAKDFWFCVPPTTFENGFTVTFRSADGCKMVRKVPSSRTLERNKIYMMDAVKTDWRPYTAGHEAVDFGLSVKWATVNIGASQPTGFGDYFAWGETRTKDNFTWSTYKWSRGTWYQMTKYIASDEYGTIDYNVILTASDDVAHSEWGGDWRIPTEAEFKELAENCDILRTTVDGVVGFIVTGKKAPYNERSIFLPAAGYMDGTAVSSATRSGGYWTSTLSTSSSDKAINAFLSDVFVTVRNSRNEGRPVRAVCGDPIVNVASLTLDCTSCEMKVNGSKILDATVLPTDATHPTVIWKSSDTNVATVNLSGGVRAKAPGTTVITATSEDGGKSATCTVTVVK